MSQRVYLGMDTSCYTTSVALLDEAGALVGEARQVLSVKPGRCGLQQSEMVFQHTRNLPRLVEEAVEQVLQSESICLSIDTRTLVNFCIFATTAGSH